MATAADLTVTLPGYRLVEQLYSGAKTVVYRAVQALEAGESRSVVIKLLQQDYPTFNDLLQFRNQYAIAKNLDIKGIVRPYCLEPYRNSYALVMEDFGGVSLREHSQNQALSLEEVLNIALQLCDILHHLHQNRVIHKDIKPANILIHPETKQVKLIDFSIASLLPKETQEIKNPNGLEGTLAYLSPEQTGRMNRGIDYRADFYAFGVTLFELLTGKLPFQSDDPMELVHCHIAKVPPSLGDGQEIPQVVSDIVMKLMAKNAEERYQSALGLKYDLEICLRSLQETGNIPNFTIAQRDVCDRFLIPEKLYGRESEVQILMKAFDRVADGASEMMLVAGFSGIGKTAVVNEVHKPIVRQRGYFIKGKFDQFNRNIPFSAFVQALRDLIGQLLSESDAELLSWKAKILEALGDNAQVIIEVIPELERIIGSQSPAPELSGTAAQNRFNLLFQKFISVFATKEHPLVMFLDDLQWADSASLKLMQLLIGESQTSYLLLIGAYRDNEVFPAHPLMLTLDEVRKTKALVNAIALQPLSENSLNQLVADTLSCTFDLAQPLTQLIYQKTQANPFFATQFLKSLYQDQLITFDAQAGYWQCDITKVRAAALTDDIVEFMAAQLQKLPAETQEILKLAACIGNSFDLQTLAIVAEQSEIAIAASLWKALQEGLILPQSEVYKFFQSENESQLPITNYQLPSYKFLHDRVQQAAYSLIVDEQKQATHLKIGQLLLNNASTTQLEENIFAIANQFNLGIEQITSHKQRAQLVSLNLIAGRKARLSAAYEAASRYCETALRMLSADAWLQDSKMVLELHLETANSAYLIGDFERVERRINTILEQTNNVLDRVRAIEIRIQSSIAKNQLAEAIQVAHNLLQSLGVVLPEHPTQEMVQLALVAIQQQLAAIDDVTKLQTMNDPEKLAAMSILSSMASAAYIGSPALYPLIVLKQIELSLQFGNALETAYAFSTYGLILCAFGGEIGGGNHAADVALALMEQFKAFGFKAKIFNLVYPFVRVWRNSLQTGLAPLLEGYQAGLASGDLEFAAYCAFNHCQLAFFAGVNLLEVQQKMHDYGDAIAHLKQATALNFHQIGQQAVLNWSGNSDDPKLLSGAVYNETERIAQHQAAGDTYSIGTVYVHKLILAYHFARPEIALEIAQMAEQAIAGVAGTVTFGVFYFYHALTLLANSQEITEAIAAYLEKLKQWSVHAPMTFAHKCDLIQAEQCRVLEQKMEAIALYDCAIVEAKASGYIQEEALSNELAAKFYLDWGKEKVAAGYMQEAYYCYARWGAKAKTDDLEKRYPDLLRPILQQAAPTLNFLETLASMSANTTLHTSTNTTRSSGTNINTVLDFTAILKASQSLSGTIQLDELLHQLTQIILQNSGGDRCALILQNSDGEWLVKASATPDKTELCSELLDNNPDLPVKLIQYVKNTKKVVVIDDLKTDLPVIDEYLNQQQPKSILCLPLLDRGNLIGILYLKNRSTSGAFTSDRIVILNFLCTQAAISLENATLYNTLEQKVSERTQELSQALEYLQSAQKKLVESEKMAALGNLVAGVAHEINTPLGTSITAASMLVAKTQSFIEAIATGSMKRSTLTDYTAIAQETGELILSNLQRAGDLVQSFKQVAVDQSNLECRTFALKGYIEEILSALQPKLKQTPHTVTVSGDDDLKITSYPGAIAQIVTNFVTNSIDHAYPQGNLGHLKFCVLQQHEQIVIQYQDDGCGIQSKHLDKIFDPFFTTARNRGGTGLGLNIVYNLVTQKLSGTIEVQSQVGSGTTFTLLLPKNTMNRS